MALDALRGIGKRRGQPAEEPTLEIGDEGGGDVISCPSCSRPILAEAPRCPGCGTRFILGVAYRKAGIFVAVGAVAGLLVGGTTMALASPGASGIGGGGGTTPGASTVPVESLPAIGVAALRQAVAIDARLSGAVPGLKSLASAKKPDAVAIAEQLRSIAADAAVGADAATRLRTWGAAADAQAQLATLYDAIRTTARDGLNARISSAAAYKSAAQRMLTVLGGLPDADASARAFGAAAGVDLPTPVPAP